MISKEEQITLLKERLFMFLEDENWNKAIEYSERILDLDPKNSDAYLAKLMIDYKVRTINDLELCKKSFENNNNFKRVVQYGDELTVTKLNKFLENIRHKKEIKENKNQAVIAIINDKLKLIVPILLGVIFLILITVFVIVPNVQQENDMNNSIIDSKKNWVDYKGMKVKLPYSEDYDVKVEDDTIVLSQGFDLTIAEFLNYVYPEDGESFTTSGSFAATNGSSSFIIEDYAQVSVQYYANGDWYGETVDLLFCGYSKYRPWYISKNGRVPQRYTSARNNGTIHLERLNNGNQKFYFEYDDEVTILGQYKSGKKVEINVVRKN